MKHQSTSFRSHGALFQAGILAILFCVASLFTVAAFSAEPLATGAVALVSATAVAVPDFRQNLLSKITDLEAKEDRTGGEETRLEIYQEFAGLMDVDDKQNAKEGAAGTERPAASAPGSDPESGGEDPEKKPKPSPLDTAKAIIAGKAELVSKNGDLRSENATLKAENGELKTELEALKAKYEQAAKDLTDVSKALVDAQGEITTVNDKVTSELAGASVPEGDQPAPGAIEEGGKPETASGVLSLDEYEAALKNAENFKERSRIVRQQKEAKAKAAAA